MPWLKMLQDIPRDALGGSCSLGVAYTEQELEQRRILGVPQGSRLLEEPISEQTGKFGLVDSKQSMHARISLVLNSSEQVPLLSLSVEFTPFFIAEHAGQSLRPLIRNVVRPLRFRKHAGNCRDGEEDPGVQCL